MKTTFKTLLFIVSIILNIVLLFALFAPEEEEVEDFEEELPKTDESQLQQELESTLDQESIKVENDLMTRNEEEDLN
ncbi:MAG: short subunit fatty acids transporter [bacterium]|jgi:short subunit fatty acids transporter